MTIPKTKPELRLQLLRARREQPSQKRAVAKEANTDHLLAELGMTPPPAPTICAYFPLASEPLSTEVIWRLTHAGWRVLLPISTAGAALDWCALNPANQSDRDFHTTSMGIAEPTGPRLGPGAIASASVVLIPALAVDPWGHRLGRGGGFYDRSLALLRQIRTKSAVDVAAGHVIHHLPAPRLIAVIFDDEYLPTVPADPHDERVTAVVSPGAGLRKLAVATPEC